MSTTRDPFDMFQISAVVVHTYELRAIQSIFVGRDPRGRARVGINAANAAHRGDRQDRPYDAMLDIERIGNDDLAPQRLWSHTDHFTLFDMKYERYNACHPDHSRIE